LCAFKENPKLVKGLFGFNYVLFLNFTMVGTKKSRKSHTHAKSVHAKKARSGHAKQAKSGHAKPTKRKMPWIMQERTRIAHMIRKNSKYPAEHKKGLPHNFKGEAKKEFDKLYKVAYAKHLEMKKKK
jgi:hypothetical protein